MWMKAARQFAGYVDVPLIEATRADAAFAETELPSTRFSRSLLPSAESLE
jgi:hypothetical protein